MEVLKVIMVKTLYNISLNKCNWPGFGGANILSRIYRKIKRNHSTESENVQLVIDDPVNNCNRINCDIEKYSLFLISVGSKIPEYNL